MRILNAAEIDRLLPYDICIEQMRAAALQTSNGEAELPLRRFMMVPGTQGKLGLMPGAVADPAVFGVKIVSKFPRADDSPYGSHVGAVMLFDAAEGIIRGFFEGGTLTAIRTASATAAATDVLARKDSRVMAVLGLGEQAHRHIDAIRQVRDLGAIRLWGRRREKAEDFAASRSDGLRYSVHGSAAEAVAEADIVCTVTASTQPILPGAALPPGCHVNLVGAAVRTSREADDEVVTRGRLFVDYRTATMNAAGEILDCLEAGKITEDDILAEIGEVIAGRHPGRTSDAEITVYKSLGTSAQDLIPAAWLLERAAAEAVGVVVDLFGQADQAASPVLSSLRRGAPG